MTSPSVVEDRPQDSTSASEANAPVQDAAPAADAAPTGEAAPAAAAEDTPGGAGESPADSADGGKRRVRLNPTFDPQRVKPIPTLTAAEAANATAAPADAEAASPDASTPPPADGAKFAAVPASEAAPEPPPMPKAPPVDIPTQADLDAEMEAEIAAALESGEIGIGAIAPVDSVPEPIAEGAEAPEPAATLETATEGTKLTGTIQTIHEDNVFVDFGWRLSGVVSLRQFSPKKPPVVGEKLDVVVDKVDEDEGLIACRLPRGTSRISGDWHALTPGQVVDCVITKTNKGGLEVSVGHLRGFMPASQVDLSYVADLQTFVGQKVQARVTEVNPARRRLVVSRRQLLQEERAVAEKELMTHLEAGQTLTGKVKTIKDYGAFVDIGGVDGFLHIGQMSWVRINHPSEIMSEGQEVEVKVLTIDSDKKKISLGMRQLAANPWSNVENKYSKGTVVTGKVTRTEAFGAFIELEPGIEGLVHISELDYKRVRAVTDVLSVGQTTEVQVLEVDPQKKRVSLSVKALKEKPDDAPASSPVEAPKYIRKEGLKGGIGGDVKGGLFGDPNKFGR